MEWFALALIPPFFWAATNFIDQYLSRRYFMGHPLAHSSFAVIGYILFLMAIAVYQPSVLSLSPGVAIKTILVGMLFYLGVIPYILAIQKEEASNALPLFQTVPFFTLVFGWILFRETMETSHIIAGIIIITGGMGMLWNFREKSFSVFVLGLMMASSAMIALHMVLLRHISADNLHWLTITFWVMTGQMLCGLTYAAFSSKARSIIKDALIHSKFRALGWDLLQHLCSFAAKAFLILAFAAAPNSTYVLLVNGIQPFLLIVFGVILGILAPSDFNRHIFDRFLGLKIIFIAMVFCGLILLLL